MNASHRARGYDPSPLTGLYVAYHYFIDVDGTLTQTRGDDERTEHTSCGMDLHKCTGAEQDVNGNSIAIVLAGDFNHEEPSRRQKIVLTGLLNRLEEKYHSKILGHREASPTQCPGTNLMSFIRSYRP